MTCVDVDAAKVDSINAGRAPIHEPGLPELLQRERRQAPARDHGISREAVRDSEITLIAVGTPAVDGRIGLEYVERAAAEIGAALKDKRDYHVVVVKSTVIPGTTDGVVRRARRRARPASPPATASGSA